MADSNKSRSRHITVDILLTEDQAEELDEYQKATEEKWRATAARKAMLLEIRRYLKKLKSQE